MRRSSSTASNGSEPISPTSPVSHHFPSTPTSPTSHHFPSSPSSHHFPSSPTSSTFSSSFNIPVHPTSPKAITSPAPSAVHNALYHALDTPSSFAPPTPLFSPPTSSFAPPTSSYAPPTSSSFGPPTLPLKGLTLIPPAVGPKSPKHSPSSPPPLSPKSHQIASPLADVRTRSLSASGVPPPIPSKPVFNKSFSSPAQSPRYQSQSGPQSNSDISRAVGSPASSTTSPVQHQMRTSQQPSSEVLMSQSFSSDVSFPEDHANLSYHQSLTLPRRSSNKNGSFSNGETVNGFNGVMTSIDNINVNSMSASFHESSFNKTDSTPSRIPLGRCSLEDLHSSELKKQQVRCFDCFLASFFICSLALIF